MKPYFDAVTDLADMAVSKVPFAIMNESSAIWFIVSGLIGLCKLSRPRLNLAAANMSFVFLELGAAFLSSITLPLPLA